MTRGRGKRSWRGFLPILKKPGKCTVGGANVTGAEADSKDRTIA